MAATVYGFLTRSSIDGGGLRWPDERSDLQWIQLLSMVNTRSLGVSQRGGKIDKLVSYNVPAAVVTKCVRVTPGVSPLAATSCIRSCIGLTVDPLAAEPGVAVARDDSADCPFPAMSQGSSVVVHQR